MPSSSLAKRRPYLSLRFKGRADLVRNSQTQARDPNDRRHARLGTSGSEALSNLIKIKAISIAVRGEEGCFPHEIRQEDPLDLPERPHRIVR